MTVLDEQMTERELEEFVRAAAATFGWWRHHHYDSRRSSPGWPDEVLLRPPEMIVAELKSERGKVSAAQRHLCAESHRRVHAYPSEAAEYGLLRLREWNA